MHNKKDLERLLSKAEEFVVGGDEICHTFYRDKDSIYFDDIRMNKSGNMQVYRKDHHGDPKSPINDRINGLFFSTNVLYGTTEPIPWSVFGDTRLLIPMEQLHRKCPNLWFADFLLHLSDTLRHPGHDWNEFRNRRVLQRTSGTVKLEY